jgi:hypothetical protein
MNSRREPIPANPSTCARRKLLRLSRSIYPPPIKCRVSDMCIGPRWARASHRHKTFVRVIFVPLMQPRFVIGQRLTPAPRPIVETRRSDRAISENLLPRVIPGVNAVRAGHYRTARAISFTCSYVLPSRNSADARNAEMPCKCSSQSRCISQCNNSPTYFSN